MCELEFPQRLDRLQRLHHAGLRYQFGKTLEDKAECRG